ncbi:P-type ATPase [Clostridium chrysemydis]|uniref:P-type ATPase n=1 Tax=Clostridium chrysemydis TaxID=2665504 RepID=UPI003F3F9471
MNNFYNSKWQDVVEGLGSDIIKGLTSIEVEKRRKTLGNNKISLPKGNSIFRQILKEFKKIYIISSLIIFFVFAYYLKFIYAFIVLLSLVLTILAKWYGIKKKEADLKYIDRINKTNVEVVRDRHNMIIPTEDLVVGDIVNFKKGSLIGADIRIIQSEDLKVDDSNVTGETFLKEKYENMFEGRAYNIGEVKNMVFKGAVIKSGSGTGIVVETGDKTSLGKLLSMLKYCDVNKHSFEHNIEKSLNHVSLMLLSAFVLITLFLNNKFNLNTIFNTLLLISLVPLSIIITVYISSVKKKFKKDGIDILNISSLDELSGLEVFFIDKIGAITKEEMIVKKLITDHELVPLEKVDFKNNINAKRAIDILLLSNDSTFNAEDNTGKGDLEEIAFLKWGAENQIYKSILDSQNRRVFELPVDTDKPFLTTITKSKKGFRANIKGNVEQIVDRCTHIMVNGIEKEITNEDLEKIRAMDFNLSGEGLITNGIAYRSFSYEPSIDENIESNLVFVGIVGLLNPLNDFIDKKIMAIKKRGIIPILFTEDNKITGEALGKKTRIINSDSEVISGVELDSLNREEIISVLSKVRVFSRVTPEIKNKIIGLFSKDKYSVLATGEGLGDLPALSLSKVGISKGKASNLVRKVSDIFISENYLDKVMMLYGEGIKVRDNIFNIFSFYGMILILQMALVNILNIDFLFMILGSIALIFIIYWRMFLNTSECNITKLGIIFIIVALASYFGVNKFNLNPNYIYLGGITLLTIILNIIDGKLIKFKKIKKKMNDEKKDGNTLK